MDDDDQRSIVDYFAGGNSQPPRCRWQVPPIATAGMLLAALLPLAWFMHDTGRLAYVLSGELFTADFDPSVVGNALDQPTIGKQFFLFTLAAAVVVPYTLAVRWLSDRRSRVGYWVFALPLIGLHACLLILLTIPAYWLIQYISAMGFTARRLRGLGFCAASCALILGSLAWQLRPWTRHRQTACCLRS